MGVTDLIPGTNADEILTAVVGVCVLLGAFAAASRKPPVRQVIRGVGWVFSRLVGEPLTVWGHRTVREVVAPIVAEEVGAALLSHTDREEELVAGIREMTAATNAQVTVLVGVVDAHVLEDRRAFARLLPE